MISISVHHNLQCASTAWLKTVPLKLEIIESEELIRVAVKATIGSAEKVLNCIAAQMALKPGFQDVPLSPEDLRDLVL